MSQFALKTWPLGWSYYHVVWQLRVKVRRDWFWQIVSSACLARLSIDTRSTDFTQILSRIIKSYFKFQVIKKMPCFLCSQPKNPNVSPAKSSREWDGMVGWLDCQRGRHRGLAALLSSLVLQVAESPLTSLTLAAQRLGGKSWNN